MKKIIIHTVIFAIAYLLFSCTPSTKKDEPTPAPTPVQAKVGTVEFVFTPKWGEDDLAFNTDLTLPSGDKLNIKEFKYFVSNIGFAKADASESPALSFPGDSSQVGIYLIDFGKKDANGRFTIKMKVAEGNYADIRYDVGVPRIFNQADITKNPYPVNGNNGMYWSWNSGFKFLVINGTSKALSAPSSAPGLNTHLSIGLDALIMPYKFRGLLTSTQLPQIEVKDGKTTTINFTYNAKALFMNGDGTNYRLERTGIPNTPDPVQVHGGFYSNVLKANAIGAIELGKFSIQ